VELIVAPDDITPEWLTEVLTAGGYLAGGRVESLEAERVGTGLVGLNVRFTLRLTPGAEGPASVVGKFPSTDPVSRATGVAMRNYEREVRFYRDVGPTVGIRMPVCYLAEIDVATGAFVLLLEDLAPARQGDQITGCTVDEADLALTELAKLHAPRWADPTLDGIDWLSRRDPATAQQIELLYQSLWPGFVAQYGTVLSAEGLALAEQLGGSLAAWLAYSQPPYTVVHGDYRLDNMLFGTPEGGYPLAVVDWQTPGHGPPVSDAAYFLGAGLPVEDRRVHEEDLMRRYHSRLVEQGVSDFSWERCWEDYRAFAFSGVVMTVVASMVVGADERGRAMFTAMGQRHTAHAIDLHAQDFLTP
jgi:hypothetical protein